MSEHEGERIDPRTPHLLAQIAHTIESGDDATARVGHVLELLAQLVPCDRCALLDAPADLEHVLRVVPDATPHEHTELSRRLETYLRMFGERVEPSLDLLRFFPRQGSEGSHLALPLVGLDQTVGILFVERFAGVPYDAQHLSLLTVVAAQLATYLTTLRLRDTQTKARQELDLAHAFQQLLVGIVSHDLRNPLGVILGSAGLLLNRTDDPRHTKSVERIISSTNRATRIINDLLDLTRVRLGDGIPITRRRTDLSELLHEAVDETAATFPARNISMEGPDSIVGEWDPDRISQVVTNLLANALQHGPVDTPVRVTLRVDASFVTVDVHNRGTPIPKETLPLIFDPFKRGEQTRTRIHVQGLGLGLYIVEQVVVGHGGRVAARSTEEDGTTFTFVLPR